MFINIAHLFVHTEIHLNPHPLDELLRFQLPPGWIHTANSQLISTLFPRLKAAQSVWTAIRCFDKGLCCSFTYSANAKRATPIFLQPLSTGNTNRAFEKMRHFQDKWADSAWGGVIKTLRSYYFQIGPIGRTESYFLKSWHVTLWYKLFRLFGANATL